MNYGIAVWNYAQPGQPLAELVGELAGMGFDSIAVQLHLFGRITSGEAETLAGAIERHDLLVTLHTNFELFRLQDLQQTLELFGRRLKTLTLDAAKITTSIGTFFSADQMRPVLETITEHAPAIRFGVEDFPLDAAALEFYHGAMGEVLEHPRYGTLLDLGHLNLRQKTHPYFAGDTAAQIRQVPVPIIEVHVHNNDGSRDLHQHLDEGNLDLAGAAQGLAEIGFDAISTLEVAPGLHDGVIADSKPRLPRSLEIWRNLMDRDSGKDLA